jgi:hypothetical protein
VHIVFIETDTNGVTQMNQTQIIAGAIVTATLEEMVRISGASVAEILSVIISDPMGNTAKRFREYIKIGTENYAAIVAAI